MGIMNIQDGPIESHTVPALSSPPLVSLSAGLQIVTSRVMVSHHIEMFWSTLSLVYFFVIPGKVGPRQE